MTQGEGGVKNKPKKCQVSFEFELIEAVSKREKLV